MSAPAGIHAGKVAIVTGAAAGIGRACAQRLAREGASVALFDVDEAAGSALMRELGEAGRTARFLRCDVGLRAEVEAAVADTEAAFGRIDIVVSNAGINRPRDFLDLDEADFDAVLRTNLKSVFLVGQAAARRMAAAGGGGAIVNMSSGNAAMSGPTLAAYAASKGGIASLTKVMALSLARHAIRVNAVAPGTILTPLTKARLWDDEARRAAILSRTPLGRFGTAEEVAGLVSFLAGPDAAYLTGQSIVLDGGRNALNYLVETPPAS